MGEHITLTAGDGFELGAYLCQAEGSSKGGVVVLQEVFGVNEHIRDVTERFAAVGYTAIAPPLYDRWEKDFDVGYTPDDIARGREHKATANDHLDQVLADVEAARAAVANAGNVGITGFCWGGFVTWMAACRLGFSAAAAYYGGGIIDFNDEEPQCPTICHFGRQDQSIPMSDVEAIGDAHPNVPMHVYEADHGFHCDLRGQFNARAANIAAMRTIRLFDTHVAGG